MLIIYSTLWDRFFRAQSNAGIISRDIPRFSARRILRKAENRTGEPNRSDKHDARCTLGLRSSLNTVFDAAWNTVDDPVRELILEKFAGDKFFHYTHVLKRVEKKCLNRFEPRCTRSFFSCYPTLFLSKARHLSGRLPSCSLDRSINDCRRYSNVREYFPEKQRNDRDNTCEHT